MRVGYYKNSMVEVEEDDVRDAVESFAEENHQIDEVGDMKFILYVEDDSGKMFSFKMVTEYYPRYEVESSEVVK